MLGLGRSIAAVCRPKAPPGSPGEDSSPGPLRSLDGFPVSECSCSLLSQKKGHAEQTRRPHRLPGGTVCQTAAPRAELEESHFPYMVIDAPDKQAPQSLPAFLMTACLGNPDVHISTKHPQREIGPQKEAWLPAHSQALFRNAVLGVKKSHWALFARERDLSTLRELGNNP